MTKKSWSGRFSKSENPLMEAFNASIAVDQRLYREDIQGSIAHAKMLGQTGIITNQEAQELVRGLELVAREIEDGQIEFLDAQEDIHMAIESQLKTHVGELAGKLHTARSRNDQVATDVILFVRTANLKLMTQIQNVQRAFVELADQNQSVILPGYTHLQRAQPVLLAHHLLAYVEMLGRDFKRFESNLSRLKRCPLGSGAIAGTTLAIDRAMTARELGFEGPTANSMDTVADRDFVIDFLSAASTLMMHLSRLSEEWILWNTQEFGFIHLPQEFSTGSSMMPQKVNPDALELIRGKTGRVYGNLFAMLTTMKALPLTYNKDMQEDKEPLFDSFDTLTNCLQILIAMLPEVRFNAKRMREATKAGFVLATDVADYLVTKGLPFRDAHSVVGQMVQAAILKKCGLEDFTREELNVFSALFAEDVKEVLNVDAAVCRRQSQGGTAPDQVLKEISVWRQKLGQLK